MENLRNYELIFTRDAPNIVKTILRNHSILMQPYYFYLDENEELEKKIDIYTGWEDRERITIFDENKRVVRSVRLNE